MTTVDEGVATRDSSAGLGIRGRRAANSKSGVRALRPGGFASSVYSSVLGEH